MYPYLNQIFSKYQCRFRKEFNAQHCLMAMIEKWRKSLDTGGHAGALLIDSSKAFDCIVHELLIAKLNAYGFDTDALKYIYFYLRGRKQRTKINSSYSFFTQILFGAPQGSILVSCISRTNSCLVHLKDQFLFGASQGSILVWCTSRINSCLVNLNDQFLFGASQRSIFVWCIPRINSCLVHLKDQFLFGGSQGSILVWCISRINSCLVHLKDQFLFGAPQGSILWSLTLQCLHV